MSELELTRTLGITGDCALFDTAVEVREIAADDDSGPAIIISQDAEPGDATPSDVVHLTWRMWNETRDYVEAYQDVMPERSDTIKAVPDEQVLYRACGVRRAHEAEGGPCVLVWQHDLMVGGSSRHADRYGQTWSVSGIPE